MFKALTNCPKNGIISSVQQRLIGYFSGWEGLPIPKKQGGFHDRNSRLHRAHRRFRHLRFLVATSLRAMQLASNAHLDSAVWCGSGSHREPTTTKREHLLLQVRELDGARPARAGYLCATIVSRSSCMEPQPEAS